MTLFSFDNLQLFLDFHLFSQINDKKGTMQKRREALCVVRVCSGEVSSLFTSCGQGGQEWPLGANVKPHISYLWPLALEPTHGDHGGVTLCSLIGRVGKVLCILYGHLHLKISKENLFELF